MNSYNIKNQQAHFRGAPMISNGYGSICNNFTESTNNCHFHNRFQPSLPHCLSFQAHQSAPRQRYHDSWLAFVARGGPLG